jgi:DedD protein
MSLLSFFRKNKQETPAEDSAFYSRAESESQAVRPRKRKATVRAGDDGTPNKPVDPVLPEKKRARRRLVGAVALVLAFVIGLPMVLDSEPKQLPDDVSIEIPSKDAATPAPAPNAAGGKVRSQAEPTALPSPVPVPTSATLDQKEEVVEVGSAAPVAAPVPAATPTAPPAKPAASPRTDTPASAKQTAVAATAHEKTKSKAETTEKSAQPTPVKTASESAGEAKHAKFTVQVAAFASQEKVNELRGKLKDAGIASYTQKVATESGERTRIRIGPVNSKQEAEKLRARLSALGLSGTLVPLPS